MLCPLTVTILGQYMPMPHPPYETRLPIEQRHFALYQQVSWCYLAISFLTPVPKTTIHHHGKMHVLVEKVPWPDYE